MDNKEKTEIADLIRWFLSEQDKQGYNVRSNKPVDYFSSIINELYILENLTSEYADEFSVISKFIRRNILGKSSNHLLYMLLHRINQVMNLFAGIIGRDIFWNLDTVIEYAVLVCNNAGEWIGEEKAARLIDNIQMAGAKKIISAQWTDVLSATDGMKAFMDVFDDMFSNAVEKYPDKFIYELKDTDVLCRMVKVKDCDEQRFIPLPECTYQNRWNPPGKAFLYMSYGSTSHPFNEDLTLEERVCLLECRTDPGTDCSFCNFRPVKPGRILDLSFNDTELSDYRKMLDEFENNNIAAVVQEMLQDKEVVARAHDESYINDEIKRRTENLPGLQATVAESTAKQYLKMICSCIYYKVDGTEEEKEKAYRSFHVLSAYLATRGITGIIYPCTRDMKIKGKNVVLFEPSDAEPITGSIKRYHYIE